LRHEDGLLEGVHAAMNTIQDVAVVDSQNFVNVSLAACVIGVFRYHLEFVHRKRSIFPQSGSTRHMESLDFGKHRLLRLNNFGNSFRLTISSDGRVGWRLVSRQMGQQLVLGVGRLGASV